MTNQTEQIREFLDKLSAPNIAIIGLVGVGKSSLINAVFGEGTAPVGAGRSVTREYTKYSPQVSTADSTLKLPVNLYDSPGYEAGKEEAVFVRQTFNFLKEKSRQGKEEQIHLVWYVISAPGARLTQFDIDILEEINKQNIPVIIVLSQCDRASLNEKSKLKEVIRKTNFSKVYETIEVAASPLMLPDRDDPNKEKPICDPFGINEIFNLTEGLLPEIYSDALIIAQVVDIEAKKEVAWKYVQDATLGCFGVGATPIPLSAPGAVIVSLGYMYNRILVVYGHTKYRLLLGISGITLGGFITLVVDGALDLFSLVFPGISILTGSTAAVFTLLSGMAFIRTCERLAINEIYGSDDEIKEQLRKIFREEFRKVSSVTMEVSRDNYKEEIQKVKNRFINNEI